MPVFPGAYHDRDPVFTDAWTALLQTGGVTCVPIPAQSPNCNPHAERFVKTVRTECLDHFVIFGECHLRHLIKEFMCHYLTDATTKGSAAKSSCRRHRRATTTRRSARSDAARVSADSSIITTAKLREPEATPFRTVREGQVIRLGAALGGKVDLVKLFEAHSKLAKADVEETKKKAK
jgi:hypothetical protein